MWLFVLSALAAPPTADALELRVSSEQNEVVFRLHNVSKQPVQALPALDGSEVGWRLPRITVEYRDGDGQPLAVPTGGRCGMMNPLMKSDVVELAPGANLQLPGPWMRLESPAGATSVRLIYDTRRQEGDASTVDLSRLPEGLWTSAWHPLPETKP